MIGKEIKEFLKKGKQLEYEEQKLQQETLILNSLLKKICFDGNGKKWFYLKSKKGSFKFKGIEFVDDLEEKGRKLLELWFYFEKDGDFQPVITLKFSEILEISEIKKRKKSKGGKNDAKQKRENC
jgi:hypothetical protein